MAHRWRNGRNYLWRILQLLAAVCLLSCGSHGLVVSGRKQPVSRCTPALFGNNSGDFSSLSSSSSWTKKIMEPGDVVVAKRELSNLGIYENKSYQLVRIYGQRFRDNQREEIDLDSLEATVPTGYDRYVQLYSPQFHKDSEAVTVTPEEAGLVSVRKELTSAAWLAVPGFFWVFVAISFSNYYSERTGGGASFSDAFWGT